MHKKPVMQKYIDVNYHSDRERVNEDAIEF